MRDAFHRKVTAEQSVAPQIRANGETVKAVMYSQAKWVNPFNKEHAYHPSPSLWHQSVAQRVKRMDGVETPNSGEGPFNRSSQSETRAKNAYLGVPNVA
jgi:hypothetical protein